LLADELINADVGGPLFLRCSLTYADFFRNLVVHDRNLTVPISTPSGRRKCRKCLPNRACPKRIENPKPFP